MSIAGGSALFVKHLDSVHVASSRFLDNHVSDVGNGASRLEVAAGASSSVSGGACVPLLDVVSLATAVALYRLFVLIISLSPPWLGWCCRHSQATMLEEPLCATARKCLLWTPR